MRVRARVGLLGALLVAGACSASRHSYPLHGARPAPSTAPAPSDTARTPSSPVTSAPVLDPDVAPLPQGRGGLLAVVVDDVGGADTFLGDYLRLPIPLTLSVIPGFGHATADDAAITAADKEVLLHIPLPDRPGGRGQPDGLATGDGPAAVDRWIGAALARVPHAVGANNHEGPFGSSSPPLMRALLGALAGRHLFYLDSVTSQSTVGFALERQVGLSPRINNVFMDHLETDADSRAALLRLARIAASTGSAIGICHVFHPYELRAILALAPQLEAKGYAFVRLSEVTNGPTPDGLDGRVRTSIPASELPAI